MREEKCRNTRKKINKTEYKKETSKTRHWNSREESKAIFRIKENNMKEKERERKRCKGNGDRGRERETERGQRDEVYDSDPFRGLVTCSLWLA